MGARIASLSPPHPPFAACPFLARPLADAAIAAMPQAMDHGTVRQPCANPASQTSEITMTLRPTSTPCRTTLGHLLSTSIALACIGIVQPASAQAVLDYAGKWTFDDCSSTVVLLRDTSGNNATATRG